MSGTAQPSATLADFAILAGFPDHFSMHANFARCAALCACTLLAELNGDAYFVQALQP